MSMQVKKYDERHGGPYDRGAADAYYRRRFSPHYYEGSTYNSSYVEITDWDSPEYEAYAAGYREQTGEKDWG